MKTMHLTQGRGKEIVAKALFYYVKELKCSPDASIQRVTEYDMEVKGI